MVNPKSNNSLTSSVQVLKNQDPIVYTSLIPKTTNTSSSSTTTSSSTSSSSSSSSSFSLDSIFSSFGDIDTTTMLYVAGGALALYLVLKD